jgi:hypothetical protein
MFVPSSAPLGFCKNLSPMASRLPASVGCCCSYFTGWDLTGWDHENRATWGGTLMGLRFATIGGWSTVMHQGARNLGWLFFLALLIGIWRALGRIQRLWPKPTGSGCFYRCVCTAFRDLDQGFQPNNMSLGLAGFWGHGPYVSHWNLGFEMAAAAIAFPLAMPQQDLLSWPSILVCEQAVRCGRKAILVHCHVGRDCFGSCHNKYAGPIS